MSFLELAQIIKAQGIKGEVKLKAFVDDLARFKKLPYVFFKKGETFEKRMVERAWVYKGYAYVKLSGCDDRNTAELLRGQTVYIDREGAAMPEEGEYFIADLLGLRVQDTDGKQLGTLQDVIKTGGVDVYEVIEDKRTLMFPLAPGVVEQIDIASGIIVVNAKRLAEVCVYA